VDTDYLSNLFGFLATRFNGDNFDKQMANSKEGKLFFEPDLLDGSRRRVKSIGMPQHHAYAVSGGNCELTFQDVMSWLYGKKYHHNYGMFSHYRSLLETMTERDFMFAARLHFFDLLSAIFRLQDTVYMILRADKRARALSTIVAAIKSRAVIA
jgi:hypothetical protein